MFYWNIWGVGGITLGLASIVLGVVVFRARPDRLQNRLLALMLVTEGIAGIGGAGLLYITDDVRIAHGSQFVNVIFGNIGLAVYGLFLATLDSRLGRFLRHWWAQIPFSAASLFLIASALYEPSWHIAGMEPTWYARLENVPGVIRANLGFLWSVFYLFGLVVAITAWREAPKGSLRRRQGAAYAAAFVWRDVLLVANMAVYSFIGFRQSFGVDLFIIGNFYATSAGFVILLAYGILRAQLFDIDLKLKWTISKGTVASVFLAVFLMVTLAASEFLVDRFGYLYGAVAAGTMLFALKPLQKAGERVANAALPGVADTDDYRTRRREEIYYAAVDSAQRDGIVSERERDVLATVAEQLGLKPTQIRAIERRFTSAL